MRLDLAIGLTAVFAFAVAIAVYAGEFRHRSEHVAALLRADRDILINFAVDDSSGAVSHEDWLIDDRNGLTTIAYHASGRRHATSVLEPPAERYEAAALYDQLAASGIWTIPDGEQAARTAYHFHVRTRIGATIHDRVLRFSDTDLRRAEQREYVLRLNNRHTSAEALRDMVKLSARTIGDPRYARVTSIMRAFGSETMQKAFADARRAAQS